MSRVLWLVIDSLGVGAAPDAADFADAGSNTFGHIAEWCARPKSEKGRGRALHIPALLRLGLGRAAELAAGRPLAGVPHEPNPIGCWGASIERSTGKDTVSGHWELCGLPVDREWGYFRSTPESFPPELIVALQAAAQCEGLLGRCHASGTEIIQRLGAEHLATGWPIVYTSADSVLQVAAHEQHFGLQRLYQLCEQARRLVDDYAIGRVIARPFTGSVQSGFQRTQHRRDWATPPFGPTLLDALTANGHPVCAVGKIHDIFSGRGISKSVDAHGIYDLMRTSLNEVTNAAEGSLVFCNLVDFDQQFGHRRDVAGYAEALEDLDRLLSICLSGLREQDLLVLSADHGNDPTWPGSDHTRECVPVLAYSGLLPPRAIGLRSTFADLGQSLASWFGLPPLAFGRAFLSQLSALHSPSNAN